MHVRHRSDLATATNVDIVVRGSNRCDGDGSCEIMDDHAHTTSNTGTTVVLINNDSIVTYEIMLHRFPHCRLLFDSDAG